MELPLGRGVDKKMPRLEAGHVFELSGCHRERELRTNVSIATARQSVATAIVGLASE